MVRAWVLRPDSKLSTVSGVRKRALNGSGSGANSKGNSSVRRGSNRTRIAQTATTAPYTPLEFLQSESLYFTTADKWDPSRLVAGIKKINFGDSFDIKDTHLEAIIAAGPSFCSSLQDFRSGDSETGKGASLSDTAVANLAAACPNLIHVKLEGSQGLTDTSLIAFFSNCPKLRYLSITGNDRVEGNLRGAALDELRVKPEWAKSLKKMRLTDQRTLDKTFKKALKDLSTKRKTLSIEVGCTHERSGGVDTWRGGVQKSGYQAFGGPGGFSQYGGF